MQSAALLLIYILIAATLQALGFLISRLIDLHWPTISLMLFLVLFLGSFALAWPIAIRVTEWLIRRSGSVVDTEQSGGAQRTDHLRPRR
jgi:hypothetical protein